MRVFLSALAQSPHVGQCSAPAHSGCHSDIEYWGAGLRDGVLCLGHSYPCPFDPGPIVTETRSVAPTGRDTTRLTPAQHLPNDVPPKPPFPLRHCAHRAVATAKDQGCRCQGSSQRVTVNGRRRGTPTLTFLQLLGLGLEPEHPLDPNPHPCTVVHNEPLLQARNPRRGGNAVGPTSGGTGTLWPTPQPSP